MLFQPLALMLVYTFAFSHLARVTIPGSPTLCSRWPA